jgi:hypothetical protein
MFPIPLTARNLAFCVTIIALTAFAIDPVEAIIGTLKAGDSKALSGYFGSSLDLTLLDHEDVYGRDQAELMLRDFFIKNPPKNFQLLHRGKSQEGTSFGIGKLATSNGKSYRISFYVKSAENKTILQELRIESE